MKWTAYCQTVDGKHAFEFVFESDFVPNAGDDINLEKGDCCCYMEALGCTWHSVNGKLIPTVQFAPAEGSFSVGCTFKDFIGLGWSPA